MIKLSAQVLAEAIDKLSPDQQQKFIKSLMDTLSDSDKKELRKAIQDTKQLSLF